MNKNDVASLLAKTPSAAANSQYEQYETHNFDGAYHNPQAGMSCKYLHPLKIANGGGTRRLSGRNVPPTPTGPIQVLDEPLPQFVPSKRQVRSTERALDFMQSG